MTLSEIKAAVKAGKTVCWSNTAYTVTNPLGNQWNIVCSLNENCIGLTWQDGVTVNGKPEEFFII